MLNEVKCCNCDGNLSKCEQTTDLDYISEDLLKSKLLPWEDYTVVAYLIIIGITALLLNGFVVFLFFKRKETQMPCDYYILNLAFIDILMPLCFPLTIYSSFHHKLAIGKYLCAAYGFIGFFRGVVSIFTLTAISCARYSTVCQSVNVQQLVHSKWCLLSIYGYAVVWAVLPLFGVGAYGPEPYGTSCTLEWDGHPVFVMFFMVLCLLVPVVIMNISYGAILFYIRRSRILSGQLIRTKFSAKKRETYLMKITFVMCVGFVTLWSPYAVISILSAFGKKDVVPIRMTLSSVLLAKLSTIVNPVIYVILNRKYRPILRQLSDKIITRKRLVVNYYLR